MRAWHREEVAKVTDGIPREPRRIPGDEIVRSIGRGSMGEVFLARQLALSRDVAVKVLEVAPAADLREAVARFRREAELMARVSHPNIVTTLDRALSGVGGRARHRLRWLAAGSVLLAALAALAGVTAASRSRPGHAAGANTEQPPDRPPPWDRKKVRRTTSAYRSDSPPTYRFYTYGFRVCKPPST
jgi:hypothetical protein